MRYLVPSYHVVAGEAYEVILEEPNSNPMTYDEAINKVDVDHWFKVMEIELESMYYNKVWQLVDVPNSIKPIGCKWVYKRKREVDGKVETFKARLVINGFTQNELIDYEETFSPVTMLKSIL
jgi:hypothetical protein